MHIYDITEVHGPENRCFINGKLVFQEEVNLLKRIAARQDCFRTETIGDRVYHYSTVYTHSPVRGY